MALQRNLARILTVSNSNEQLSQFQLLFNEVVQTGTLEDIKTIAMKLIGDIPNPQLCRTVVTEFSSSLQSCPEAIIEEAHVFLLPLIKNQNIPFDEADYILRTTLFTYYIKAESFSQAASTLSELNLDSSVKVYSESEKADILIKCAEAFLEDDESVDAEIFVNKASTIMNNISDRAINLRYRTTFARVLDANRKFLEASSRYFELSNTAIGNVDAQDLLVLLGKAVTCAVLSKPSSQRARLISLLCKDHRLGRLDEIPQFSTHGSVLVKMDSLQLITQDESSRFTESLLSHQKAKTSDGFSIVEKAFLEHNMLAVQKIYDNISFSQLALLLNINLRSTEKMCAKMLTEGRLLGTIDQTEGYLIFDERNSEESSETDMKVMMEWDKQISNICNEIGTLSDYCKQKYPAT